MNEVPGSTLLHNAPVSWVFSKLTFAYLERWIVIYVKFSLLSGGCGAQGDRTPLTPPAYSCPGPAWRPYGDHRRVWDELEWFRGAGWERPYRRRPPVPEKTSFALFWWVLMGSRKNYVTRSLTASHAPALRPVATSSGSPGRASMRRCPGRSSWRSATTAVIPPSAPGSAEEGDKR